MKSIKFYMVSALILAAFFLFSANQNSLFAQVSTRIGPTIKPQPQLKTRLVPIVGPKLKIKVTKEIKDIEFPEMASIDGSTFVMGDQISKKANSDNPQHKVELPSFLISKNPITNKQFRQFVNSTDYKTEAEREPNANEKANNISWKKFAENRDNYPVIWISYNDANAYCRWLSLIEKNKQTNKTVIDEEQELAKEEQDAKDNPAAEVFEPFRLPTEAEWEYVASYDFPGAPFPWGDNADKNNLNCAWNKRDTSFNAAKEFIKPVNDQSAISVGVKGLSGNVAQWCFDWYDANSYSTQIENAIYFPYGPDNGKERVVRGGSWADNPDDCKVFARNKFSPSARNSYVSFRIARSKPSKVEIIDGDE